MQFPLRYHVPYQAAVDGNTVELDVERAKFAESAVRYEFALDRVRSHYMHMEDLLKNLK
jgi:flagellar basal-body rod protein FlgB